MKQFELVNVKYGAPMGRHSYGEAKEISDKRISLFKVNLYDGGYDDGGAYWGVRDRGYSLYCARTDDDYSYQAFTNARSRSEAQTRMGIPSNKLRRRTSDAKS